MTELPFLVSPQVQVGAMRSTVEVRVTSSPTVFPDHEQFVTVQLWSLDRQPHMLADLPRVGATEREIDNAVTQMGVRVGGILDREDLRRRKLHP